MLNQITEFVIENWLILTFIASTFFSIFFTQEVVEILSIPFKVVWLILRMVIKFFKWLAGLFKKPANALKKAKRLERT